jgi:hypothetical protein
MAGRGPAPKDPDKRRRRNADPVPASTLLEDDEVRGPELPGGIEWPVVTLAWWTTWRNSPQAATFTDTDWDFLVDTALLHARFWKGDEKVAGELRLRVAKFGATPEDRARLRMQVGEPDGGRGGSGKSDDSDDPYAGLRVS